MILVPQPRGPGAQVPDCDRDCFFGRSKSSAKNLRPDSEFKAFGLTERGCISAFREHSVWKEQPGTSRHPQRFLRQEVATLTGGCARPPSTSQSSAANHDSPTLVPKQSCSLVACRLSATPLGGKNKDNPPRLAPGTQNSRGGGAGSLLETKSTFARVNNLLGNVCEFIYATTGKARQKSHALARPPQRPVAAMATSAKWRPPGTSHAGNRTAS